MDIEKSFISIVLQRKQMIYALEENVTDELFTDENKAMWRWMHDFYTTNVCTPNLSAFKFEFPNFSLETTPSPIGYYLKKLRDKCKYNLLRASMQRAAKLMQEGKVDEALELQLASATKAKDIVAPIPDVDWASTAHQRYQRYKELQEYKGIDGIPCGFPTIDALTCGFHAEELIFIVARQGVGKTMLECVWAMNSYLDGYKPLLFSKEMSALSFNKRLDALYSKLPYQQMRTGKLTTEQEIRWQKDIEKIKKMPPMYVVGEEGGGVSHVAAKIGKYRPDIVYIDGMYLLGDDRKADSDWLRMTHIAQDLKSAAKKFRVPIVVSLQLNKKKSKDESEDIAQGDIAKAADLGFSVYQSEDDRLAGIMKLRLWKQREGQRGEIQLVWDHNTMEFCELQLQNASESAGEEELADI